MSSFISRTARSNPIPMALVAGSEASWVSSNDTALYGLAAIENLALLGDKMP